MEILSEENTALGLRDMWSSKTAEEHTIIHRKGTHWKAVRLAGGSESGRTLFDLLRALNQAISRTLVGTLMSPW